MPTLALAATLCHTVLSIRRGAMPRTAQLHELYSDQIAEPACLESAGRYL
jgi:hypothetical protein